MLIGARFSIVLRKIALLSRRHASSESRTPDPTVRMGGLWMIVATMIAQVSGVRSDRRRKVAKPEEPAG
jgi:hypothetical protein